MGTKQVLSFIAKGLKIKEDTLLPTVFLGMIPETFSRREKQEIKENLLGCFETTEVKEELLDNMIVELPFASELIHLTEWKQILNVLKDRDMYDAVKELVKPYCISEEPERGMYTEKQHQIITKQICDFANNQITAEANGAEELLLTEPIKNLCARFNHQIPVTVVQGAKGSGKTFLYRQLIEDRKSVV